MQVLAIWCEISEKGMFLSIIQTDRREGRLHSVAAASSLGGNVAKL